MGLKKTNVTIENSNITLPEAYAQIHHLATYLDSRCLAVFKIQTSRENMTNPPLDMIPVAMNIDKDLPLFRQVYEYAKETVFQDWEDDIPSNDEPVEE